MEDDLQQLVRGTGPVCLTPDPVFRVDQLLAEVRPRLDSGLSQHVAALSRLPQKGHGPADAVTATEEVSTGTVLQAVGDWSVTPPQANGVLLTVEPDGPQQCPY
ncbi:MAG: hypothetical protein Q4G45_10225 [Actinomycetia bacterium]|nr:hypothetical protein [Actinomycetes bacterium]